MADQRDDRVPFEPIHGRRGFREHLDPMQFPAEGMPGARPTSCCTPA